MNNSKEETGKEGKSAELYAASDSERNSLVDWYKDHSHIELHDEGINTLCKICPPEEYGEDEDCEGLQNIMRVMFYRLTELEAQIQQLEPKFTELEMECKRLKAELKRKDEALRDMLNYPIVTNAGISNYGDGYNDALKEMRRLAEKALTTNTDGQ